MSSENKYRTVIFYKDYFDKFFTKQNQKVKEKIIWTFELIEDFKRVPETYLKHIESTEGLYEIRVRIGRTYIRIFCFFDRDKLIIIIHGFQKKTKKTPRKEIETALKIMEEYRNDHK